MRLTLVLLPLLALASPPDVKVLRWTSPDSSRPGTFRDYRSGLPSAPAWSVRRLASSGPAFDNRVDVLVQDSLVPALAPLLDTLLLDLAAGGFPAVAFSCSGTSAESLRAFLQSERDSGLVAATLIGNLPIAWFQMIDDWNNNHRRDPDEGYEEFPCDLYFMDLDGIWEDNSVRYDTLDSLVPGRDSIYDLHSGAIEPEIGVSRLPASTVGRADSLLRLYLSRSHAYRTGGLPVSDRALVYIDDDWVPAAPQWDAQVGMLYDNRVSIWNEETTRIADYRPRIDTAAYQWIALCSHSWPGGHGMKFNNGRSWDWFYATSIPGLNPQACFYNLFACSNVRFTENGYCGGMYVFRTATGLGAIGSCKTGSMLEFQDFYWPLSNGQPLALAFQEWFAGRAAGGFEPWERSWFYGMSLIGDGLLKPRVPTGVAERTPSATRHSPSATVVRNVLNLESAISNLQSDFVLQDICGRTVRSLRPGPNDLSRLAAGVYFVRTTTGRETPSRPVVLVQ